jgi:uncharacterized protein (UPF0261 family)
MMNNALPAVYLLATLDTKGAEAAFLRDRLIEAGVSVRVVDVGALGTPAIAADIPREEVFRQAETSLEEIQGRKDRGDAVTAAAEGAANLVREHHARGLVAGVLAIGGSAGTTIGTAAMRALPLGVPKVMISTLASGNVRPFVQHKDIAMFNPIVDISGLNRVSRAVFANAAGAIAGMVQSAADQQQSADKPIIAATMFGVTTPCVEQARATLEAAGYEVLVFHATGSGGAAMESLIEDGAIAGVLDLTTTELADELCGGVLSAGPARLTAAGRKGIPQVISVGATDMINFHAVETLPAEFRARLYYRHNPNVTLIRTTPRENTLIGRDLATKAAAATGPTAILLPLGGVSAIDRPGQPFADPAARESLFAAIREHKGPAELVELPWHINDHEFATAAAEKLLAMLR